MDTNEIWVCDFEFKSGEGEIPAPVCFCALELNSNRKIRLWLDGEPNTPAPIDFTCENLTYVAYYSVAEMSCHLALNWPIPENIIDLYCEWRILTNSGTPTANGLLNACAAFNVPIIGQEQKDVMRERILRGNPYCEQDKEDILNYCETDIIETASLFQKMSPLIDSWERALFRGQYMAINAKMEHQGVPIDMETLNFMRENWDLIKLQLIKDINAEFGFFDGLTFKVDEFTAYLLKNNLQWAFTEKGNLRMDDDTWKEMALIYPELEPVRQARALVSKFKKINVACGSDGKNRGMLSPFSTKTGRNAPKVQCIFTNPSWMRCLIKPKENEALAYIDYEQQEFLIAAMLSKDKNMQATYNSGDPYLQFAKMAGAIPPDGTKNTHKGVRDVYKQSCLAIQYGMRASSLAFRINRPLAYAHELIRQHQRLFPKYWEWQDEVVAQSKLNMGIHTSFGWKMKVQQGTTKEDLTLGNFLMQATGADILRIACYLLTEANIKIIAPVHDAIMIQVPLISADLAINKAEKIMQEASKIVLGVPLRTETLVVKYPERYMDVKGRGIWEKAQKIMAGIKEGSIVPEYSLLGSKWAKHVEKLNKISHKNLSSWYKDIDADKIDFEALKDSSLSGIENRKNLKNMWRDYL